jgi:hypothetical protein
VAASDRIRSPYWSELNRHRPRSEMIAPFCRRVAITIATATGFGTGGQNTFGMCGQKGLEALVQGVED